MIKQAIKIVASLFCGMLIGTGIVFLVVMAMTGKSPETIANILAKADIADIAVSCTMSMAAFIITTMLQIVIHESGHLVGGLLTGYRFVSFRICNIALIRHDGSFALRRYSVAGTGGQCLMTPPDTTPEAMPYAVYNAGGIVANIVVATAATAALLLYNEIPLFAFHLLIFTAITGVFFATLNGIPMKMNGVTNDGYNIMMFRHNVANRKLFANQLRINGMIQDGTRPRDIPKELFEIPSPTDYSEAMHASAVLMAASRKLDTGDMTDAHAMLCEAENHRNEMIGLLVKETECELIFTSLVIGDIAEARRLYTDELKKYITAYRNTMSSKQRILCAIAILMDGDETKARRIYDEMEAGRGKYMMQGEVKMDLALTHALIDGNTGMAATNEKTGIGNECVHTLTLN